MQQTTFFFFFDIFFRENKPIFHVNHEMSRLVFSGKIKEFFLECHLLQILLGVLRVKRGCNDIGQDKVQVRLCCVSKIYLAHTA